MRKVNTMPTAATIPKSLIGGRSLTRLARKPITVVPVTMKKATSSWSVASRIAPPAVSCSRRPSR
jgi:hypothetical protein